jgi:hypothetical protein
MRFKSVFDPRFRYRNADSTDVRLTFERIRREYRKTQRQLAEEQTTQERSVEKELERPVR